MENSITKTEHRSVASDMPIRPGLGICVIIVTTLLAVFLVPENPEPAGVLFWPGAVMTLGLLAIPVATFLQYPKSILRGEHLLVLAPIYWLLLDPLQGAYDLEQIWDRTVKLSLIAIGVFTLGVWLASAHRPWRLPSIVTRSVAYEFQVNALFVVILSAFCLGILRFAIPCNFNPVEMVHYLGEGRWDAPWTREQLGGWDSFRDVLQYFGYLLPVLTVLLAGKTGWFDFRTIVSLILSIIMASFLAQEGGRRIIGAIVGMGLVLWVIKQKRFRPSVLVMAGLCVAGLLFIMQTMLDLRNEGLAVALDKSSETEKHEYLHIDDNFLRLCQIIQIIPREHPHVYLRYPLFIFVRPIPRILWEGKPVDPGFDLPEFLGIPGVSLSMSVVGEFYLAGGLIAVLLGGWFYGRVAGMAFSLLTGSSTPETYVVYSIFVMSLFVGMRSMLDLVLINYVVVAWILLCRVLGGRKQGRLLTRSTTKPLPT